MSWTNPSQVSGYNNALVAYERKMITWSEYDLCAQNLAFVMNNKLYPNHFSNYIHEPIELYPNRAEDIKINSLLGLENKEQIL